MSTRTSPLNYEDGYLAFAVYKKNAIDIYSVKTDTGRKTMLGSVKDSTPFGYIDLEPNSSGEYYYVKSSGEIGKGSLASGSSGNAKADTSANETVLCRASYNISSGKGVRPFYVRKTDAGIFVMDYWGGALYELKDGKLAATDFDAGEVSEISSCCGRLCGITGETPWYLDGSKIIKMPTKVKTSMGYALNGHAADFIQTFKLWPMLIALLYVIIGIAWYVFTRGRHFVWKLTIAFLFVFMVFVLGAYLIFNSERQSFFQDNLTQQNKIAELAADTLDASDVESIKTSSDMDGRAYNDITNQLVDDFSIYQKDSDMAVILLINGADGHLMAASNRGYGGLLGSTSSYEDLISKLGDRETYGAIYDDTLRMSIAPVKDKKGEAAGYVVVYTEEKIIWAQFISLWKTDIIVGFLLLIAIALLLSTRLVSYNLARVSSTIKSITSGNYSIRLDKLSRDEIGEVGRSVNMLSENIEELIAENSEKNLEIQKSQEEVLVSLAGITEAKSGQTAEHVRRVGEYVKIMATEISSYSENREYSEREIRYISTASMLHDIGKLMTPVEILEKPGKLTKEEFEIIKRHTTDGEALLHNGAGEIMKYARTIALEHHERWDGTGYPGGLAGNEIALEARMTSVADVFDALVSRRSYKEAFPVQRAHDIIIEERGKQFDPVLVDLFEKHFDEFCSVPERYPDTQR